MSIDRSFVFLEVIENLSKSPHISKGNVQEMAKEVLHKAAHYLKIRRTNIWTMDQENNKLVNILAYDRFTNSYYTEPDILGKDNPTYFEHIRLNEFITSSEAQNESFYKELANNYLIPHNIISMMEIPISSGGILKGIICFENTNGVRNWPIDEKQFALTLTQFMILTIENNEKNAYRDKLEKIVIENSAFNEKMNLLVQSNLEAIMAFQRSEAEQIKDEADKEIITNIIERTFLLSTLQNPSYLTKSSQQVNLSEFIKWVVATVNVQHGNNLSVEQSLNLGLVRINIIKAVPLSLTIYELLNNCYKHAFKPERRNKLSIDLSIDESGLHLKISDNGPGLPENYRTSGNGFVLMMAYVDQMEGEMSVKTSAEGTAITVLLKYQA